MSNQQPWGGYPPPMGSSGPYAPNNPPYPMPPNQQQAQGQPLFAYPHFVGMPAPSQQPMGPPQHQNPYPNMMGMPQPQNPYQNIMGPPPATYPHHHHPNAPPQQIYPVHHVPHVVAPVVHVTTSTPAKKPSVIKNVPTLLPHNPFSAQVDAQTLRTAMKGFGTDEKAIIDVLAKRTNAQRLQIAAQFKTLFSKDLIKNLKSETRGEFEQILVAMMTPLSEYYAQEVHNSVAGFGTKEDVLIEILCTTNNNMIRNIASAYQRLYSNSLEKAIKGDTSGTFERLLLSLCNAQRDESNKTDLIAAAADAKQLYEAGEGRMGTSESNFIQVFCLRNYQQLLLIFDEYLALTGHGIEKAIKGEFSGSSKDLLLALIDIVRDRPIYFAQKLNQSMSGLGTRDRDLIRLVITRCEIDMENIKAAYSKKHGKALSKAIKGDISGDYLKTVLTLIGETNWK